MSKEKLHRFFAKAHKWIGLVLGIQLVFWTVGGIVMSWIPIETVRGEHKIVEADPMPLAADANFASVAMLAAQAGQQVLEIRHAMLMGQPVAKLLLADGGWQLRDAHSGALLSPISAAFAQKIAEADFSLAAPVKTVRQITEDSIDYHGALPVWQITFDDRESSAIYVSPVQARVVARRSTVWRFYDFFWMLHIMDYEDRNDFNNWLLIATSFFAALFALSGFSLLFFRFYRRDFNFILGKKNKRVDA